MFGLIKKIFIRLLTGLVNGFNHPKKVSLSNQKCMTQPTLINLYLAEYSQEFRCYPLLLKLDTSILEVLLEVSIYLMTYLIKYVYQKKQKI